MNSNINGYDDMKNMLSKVRTFKKTIINEDFANLQPEEIKDEETKFKEGVSPNVQFGPFKKFDGNIEFSGVLIKEKISWIFSLAQADGCIISCENLSLSDENVKTIQKLSSYYKTWSEYWNSAINN